MKKTIILLAMVAAMICTLPVLALSDISDAIYTGQIAINNAGTATTNVATVMTLSSANLIAANYMGVDCLDSTIMINAATDAAYMPAPGDTTNWCILVPTASTSQQIYNLYTGGGTDMTSVIRYFPGAGGVAVTDHATMECGTSDFEFEIKGCWNTDDAGGGIILKTGALVIASAGGNQITVTFYGGAGNVLQTANGCTSGAHTFKYRRVGDDLSILWDDVVKDTDPVTAPGDNMVNTVNNWGFCYSNATGAPCLYMEYLKVTINGTLQCQLEWQYDDAAPYQFDDSSGNNHNGVPTFRAASTDADVSATLLNFLPITEAKASSSGVLPEGIFTDAPDEPDEMYEEDQDSSGFFLVPIFNNALDDADVPRAIFYYPLAIFFSIMAGAVTWGFAKKKSPGMKGTQSLLLSSLVAGFVYALFWQIHLVAGWPLFIYIMPMLSVLVAERRQQI